MMQSKEIMSYKKLSRAQWRNYCADAYRRHVSLHFAMNVEARIAVLRHEHNALDAHTRARAPRLLERARVQRIQTIERSPLNNNSYMHRFV